MGCRTRCARSTWRGCAGAGVRATQIGEKQATEAFVAGAIGPLGVRLEPLGKIGLDEAQAAFAEQMAALAEGGPGVGADLLVIETMTSLAEAEQAMRAAKQVAPAVPVMVMVTVDEDGNCLDGASPETAAAQADGVGRGCGGVQLQRGAGDGAERDRADARGDARCRWRRCRMRGCRGRWRGGISI